MEDDARVAGDPKVTPAQAQRYDTLMVRLERRWFPETRAWVCSRARGHTLEVAVGTGLNLRHYASGVTLTGVDLNQPMLDLAAARADGLGRAIALHQGNAARLPFGEASFDSVVCTFAMCEVPDVDAALTEALRVLRPGGSLLLADHVAASNPFLRAGQHALELLTIPLSAEV